MGKDSLYMNDLDLQYKNIIKELLNQLTEYNHATDFEKISIFGNQIKHQMSSGFPITTLKEIPFQDVIKELICILKGHTNVSFLLQNDSYVWIDKLYDQYDKNYDKLPVLFGVNFNKLNKEDFVERLKHDNEFETIWGNLGPVHGKQWRSFNKISNYEYDKEINENIDQITKAVRDLIFKPELNNLLVLTFNLSELDQMVYQPNDYMFQLHTRKLKTSERVSIYEKLNFCMDDFPDNDKDIKELLDDFEISHIGLSLLWNHKSIDVLGELPYMISFYGLLLEFFAKTCNMKSDFLISNLGETYLDKNKIEIAERIISKEINFLPNIKIDSDNWNFTNVVSDRNFNFDSFLDSIRIQDFKLENLKFN